MYEWLHRQWRSIVSVGCRLYMRYIWRVRIDALLRIHYAASICLIEVKNTDSFNRRVTALMSHLTGNRTNKLDDRRNLYVLGLPFTLTK